MTYDCWGNLTAQVDPVGNRFEYIQKSVLNNKPSSPSASPPASPPATSTNATPPNPNDPEDPNRWQDIITPDRAKHILDGDKGGTRRRASRRYR
ncbi:hypothetical protein CHELA1G11_12830 [Hyphomicrobiales bacterium]|nr:hypothetical protein CHELA1G2_11479 [Hyphomicrobiales bacterium]CAH1667419.1 hypothetical protein CHELA1G11_12830 [Hyphomicrobiales bacterium]